MRFIHWGVPYIPTSYMNHLVIVPADRLELKADGFQLVAWRQGVASAAFFQA